MARRWPGYSSRLDMEISFRDQVYAFQELSLTDAGVAVRAFTLHELIAEKFRALLQQPIRIDTGVRMSMTSHSLLRLIR